MFVNNNLKFYQAGENRSCHNKNIIVHEIYHFLFWSIPVGPHSFLWCKN